MLPRILVMEQDRMIRVLLHEILSSEGYTPLVARDGVVLDDVRHLRPAAILIDPFGADDDGGWDALGQLRADPATASIPIVVCTADAKRLGEVPEDQLALANRIVLKPFDLDELLGSLGAVTGAAAFPSSSSSGPAHDGNQVCSGDC